MWKCGLQQVGHELLYIGHILYGCNVRSQRHSYSIHFHQTEHVRQDGRMHQQTYSAAQLQLQYTVIQKMSLFFILLRLYKCQPISIIFVVQFTESICNTITITHLHTAATLLPAVRQHTTHVRWASYCSVKLRRSFLAFRQPRS